jgi:hypothetical protein
MMRGVYYHYSCRQFQAAIEKIILVVQRFFVLLGDVLKTSIDLRTRPFTLTD